MKRRHIGSKSRDSSSPEARGPRAPELQRTLWEVFRKELSLWLYFWLAETSHKPINQTTWLKVNPDCNYCNHGGRNPARASHM
eukprot:1161083-Pelagomonas_calceolata.AAC.1